MHKRLKLHTLNEAQYPFKIQRTSSLLLPAVILLLSTWSRQQTQALTASPIWTKMLTDEPQRRS